MTPTIGRVKKPARRYDFDVVLRLLEYDADDAERGTPGALTMATLADQLGVDIRSVQRWKAEGLPDHQADRVAVELLGLPAMLVWPEWMEWGEVRTATGRLSRSAP